MDARDLLQCILNLSQQAANIACLIREDEQLNELLIASKGQRVNGDPDFKTLADVLIQAAFTYGVHKQFPKFLITVRGEEDGCFPNPKGSSVSLKITDDISNTRLLLSQILDDKTVVEKLSVAVHKDVYVHDDLLSKIAGILLPEVLSIWIDPIDGTKSYIMGQDNLNSVTVLVGVHHAGQPILGSVTYPFLHQQVWGLSYNGSNVANIPRPTVNSPIKTVYVSTVENESSRDMIRSNGYQIEAPMGAGNKLSGVIMGSASFYLVSKPTTYQWDTCGPHAILRAIGGDIIHTCHPRNSLHYNDSRAPNNSFIAFLNREGAERILNELYPDKKK